MTKPTGRRPGRPKTTGPTTSRSMRIGPIFDQARALAERRGETITAVVERALAAYVAEHGDARSTSARSTSGSRE